MRIKGTETAQLLTMLKRFHQVRKKAFRRKIDRGFEGLSYKLDDTAPNHPMTMTGLLIAPFLPDQSVFGRQKDEPDVKVDTERALENMPSTTASSG